MLSLQNQDSSGILSYHISLKVKNESDIVKSYNFNFD